MASMCAVFCVYVYTILRLYKLCVFWEANVDAYHVFVKLCYVSSSISLINFTNDQIALVYVILQHPETSKSLNEIEMKIFI